MQQICGQKYRMCGQRGGEGVGVKNQKYVDVIYGSPQGSVRSGRGFWETSEARRGKGRATGLPNSIQARKREEKRGSAFAVVSFNQNLDAVPV